MKRKSAHEPKAKVIGVKKEAVAVETKDRVKSHKGCYENVP